MSKIDNCSLLPEETELEVSPPQSSVPVSAFSIHCPRVNQGKGQPGIQSACTKAITDLLFIFLDSGPIIQMFIPEYSAQA